MKLSYQAPLDWDGLLRFLGPRATPGVEDVRTAGPSGVLQRSFRLGDTRGVVEVRGPGSGQVLPVRVHTEPALLPADRRRLLRELAESLARVFDLAHDPAPLNACLGRDPALRRALTAARGVRVPGAFDPFEVTVRAILGQQVTVKGATTLAGRLVAAHGESLPAALRTPGLTHLFPRPEVVARADLTAIGLPRQRAAAISGLAGAVAAGQLELGRGADGSATAEALQSLPGIGPWTAQYVAMRVLGDADAFPASDLGLRKALAVRGELPTVAAVGARAERWRPWRAYAAMLLWGQLAAAPAQGRGAGSTG